MCPHAAPAAAGPVKRIDEAAQADQEYEHPSADSDFHLTQVVNASSTVGK